jgi:hypothetical protein
LKFDSFEPKGKVGTECRSEEGWENFQLTFIGSGKKSLNKHDAFFPILLQK